MGVFATAARMDAGDHLADDTDVSGANFARGHIDDLRIDQQQIKRGIHRARPARRDGGLEHCWT